MLDFMPFWAVFQRYNGSVVFDSKLKICSNTGYLRIVSTPNALVYQLGGPEVSIVFKSMPASV